MYQELIDIINKYNATEKEHISDKLKTLLKSELNRATYLKNLLGISSNTSFCYFKTDCNKIPLTYLLLICDDKNISVEKFLKQVDNIKPNNTKQIIKNDMFKEFIMNNYKSMSKYAEHIRVSRKAIYRWINEGMLPDKENMTKIYKSGYRGDFYKNGVGINITDIN